MTPEKKLDKAELAKLLETPLDPDLNYFDATASIEAMANHIRDLHALIRFLFESMGTQGQAILDIREKMIAHKEAIEFMADAVCPDDKTKTELIGFDTPALLMPGKTN